MIGLFLIIFSMRYNFQKKYTLGLVVLLCVWVIGVSLFVWTENTPLKDAAVNLSELQEVQESSQQLTELPLTPERLKQLQQLEEIVQEKENIYEQTLQSVLARSAQEWEEAFVVNMEAILRENLSVEEAQTQLRELGLERILLSDTRRLIEAYQSQEEEQEVHQLRLENLKENNREQRQAQEKELIVLIIVEQLEKSSELSSIRQKSLSDLIATRLDQNTEFFEMSKLQKYDFLSTVLTQSFSRFREIEESQGAPMIQAILWNLETMTLIESPQITWAETSWFQAIIPKASASETGSESYSDILLASIRDISSLPASELSDTRKKILHLQIDILTDVIIEQLIDAERGGSIDSEKKAQLYTLLEEILLLKETIENPAGSLSLDEIQAYNLGQYVDDSEYIQEQNPLAFISSKTGYIFVKNLSESYKLWVSNMLLYDGYTIETWENSEATLIFADESILRLEPNSRVLLRGPANNLTAELQSGNIWARVIKPIISGNTFDIEASWVSLWVRGTSLYISQSTGEVYIVDSYHEDASVELDGWVSLQAGQKLDILSGNASPSNFTRQELLSNFPDIGNFLRNDLVKLSLLLDDKTRGFHNNPLSSSNGDESYLERLRAEIENSLPRGEEKSQIFLSPEIASLADNDITLESLYRLTLQDRLLSTLEASNSPHKVQNKNILLASDFEALENELGNKRALERRYELGLAGDIIDTALGTTNDLEILIRNFPIPQREEEREILEQAALELWESLNGGSRIILEDFSLPRNYNNVNLSNWISSNGSILSISGNSATRSSPSWTVILTVTLTLGQQSIDHNYFFEVPEREPSLQDELEEAAEVYLSFLEEVEYFTDTLVPESALSGSILSPENITFSWAHVFPNGATHRPWFNDFEPDDGDIILGESRYKKIAELEITFTHPEDTSVSREEEIEDLYVKNQSCDTHNGSIILWEWADAVCYSLVAKAEYKNNNLELKNVLDNTNITRTWSWITILPTNGINLNLRCTSAALCPTIWQHLSYRVDEVIWQNDDWLIEIETDTSSLQDRWNNEFYYLLTSPWNFIIHNQWSYINFRYLNWTIASDIIPRIIWNSISWWNKSKIQIGRNDIFVNDVKYRHDKNLKITDYMNPQALNIATSSTKRWQWEWNIYSVKVFKKEE